MHWPTCAALLVVLVCVVRLFMKLAAHSPRPAERERDRHN